MVFIERIYGWIWTKGCLGFVWLWLVVSPPLHTTVFSVLIILKWVVLFCCFNHSEVRGFILLHFSKTMFCNIRNNLTFCEESDSFTQWTKILICYNLDTKPTFPSSVFLPQNSYERYWNFSGSFQTGLGKVRVVLLFWLVSKCHIELRPS